MFSSTFSSPRSQPLAAEVTPRDGSFAVWKAALPRKLGRGLGDVSPYAWFAQALASSSPLSRESPPGSSTSVSRWVSESVGLFGGCVAVCKWGRPATDWRSHGRSRLCRRERSPLRLRLISGASRLGVAIRSGLGSRCGHHLRPCGGPGPFCVLWWRRRWDLGIRDGLGRQCPESRGPWLLQCLNIWQSSRSLQRGPWCRETTRGPKRTS